MLLCARAYTAVYVASLSSGDLANPLQSRGWPRQERPRGFRQTLWRRGLREPGFHQS